MPGGTNSTLTQGTGRDSGPLYSVLVVGCGLIGTSLALGLRQRSDLALRLVGMDLRADHRTLARDMGAFDDVSAEWPEEMFDLVILAIPARAATASLATACQLGRVVMDVCSIKGPLCAAAQQANAERQFAPTHPMAGLAAEGPAQSNPDLFVGQAWILLREWAACHTVEPLVRCLGAVPIWLDTPEQHDNAMAVVSHGIHVTSLSAMLAYERARVESGQPYAKVSGPGLRDITRLASSPPDFWVDTLLANKESVVRHIAYVADALAQFAQAVERENGEELRRLLEAARSARSLWEQQRDRD